MIKKVIDVDLKELDQMSLSLGRKIKADGFIPDHILYVERAGLLIGNLLAGYFKADLSDITCQRMGTSAKSGIKEILRGLPRWATHLLRRVELLSSMHKAGPERRVTWNKALDLADKKILVVDDAVDTGYSLRAILQYLLAYGLSRRNIRIAVLTTTGKNPSIRPEYSLHKNTICAFPWSYDAREFYQTREKMEDLRFLIHGNTVYNPHLAHGFSKPAMGVNPLVRRLS